MMLGIFPKSLVTMAIEGASLRIMVARGRKVHLWANIPFNPRLLRNGIVVDSAALGQVIDSAFKAGNLPRRHVICALTGLQAVSRLFTVPKVERANLRKVVEREIRRQLPSAREDSFLHWQAMDSKAEAQQRVYVLTLPRTTLLAFLEALRAARVRPHSMDLKPLALARSVNQKDAIVANLEGNSLDVIIVLDDIPVIMRSIHLGDEPVAPEMATARFTDELSRTIAYYNDTNRANPLPPEVPAYLTGDLATDPSLGPLAESTSGHPVIPLEPPLEYPSDFPVAQYMVNIGLALKEL